MPIKKGTVYEYDNWLNKATEYHLAIKTRIILYVFIENRKDIHVITGERNICVKGMYLGKCRPC